MTDSQYLKYHRDSDYLENQKLFRNIFLKRVNIIKRFVNKPGRVLDIGASTGTMLDIFKSLGWNTFGVEPSASAKIAIKKGHKITNLFFEKTKFVPNSFDLIIMNHTLEHLDNPQEILIKAYGLVKKGGFILVDVPNAGGVGSRILGNRWPYLLPKEHKSQFTKESLSTLFKNAGFKIVYFDSRSGIFEYANPLAELWQALTGFKKRFLVDILTSPYSLIVSLLKMGDSMSLVGKKI